MTQRDARPPRRGLRLLRRLLPFVVGALLLAWIFWRVPFREFTRALASAEFAWFLPAMLATMVGIYFADCLAISKTFTWFMAPLPYRDVLPIRGASYLLAVLNYNLGQGAIAIFVNRAKGVTLMRATGTVLFIMGTNAVVMLIFSTIGAAWGDTPGAVAFRPWVFGGMIGFGLYLALVTWPPRFLARRDLFAAVIRAGALGHLAAIAVRLPHMLLVFLAHYIAMRAFHIDPPAVAFFTAIPLVGLVSAVPISPQGLGTTQVAAVYFFSAYAIGSTTDARQAQVLAYSLTTSVMVILFMLTMGILWFRRGMRLLRLEGEGAGEQPTSATS